MEIRKAPKRLVRMACTAAVLATLGLVTLLLTGQAAPPTPRQGAELRFAGPEADYNVQVENITAPNLKLQTNYKLRKPQGEPLQKQLPQELDFVDVPANLASEDYTPDDGPASLPKPQKRSSGSPKKYTPIPPPNPQVYVLPTEDVRLVFPDDDENDMAAGLRAVDEELGRPSDLHAIILESGEDADTFSRALHNYQSRNYHSRTEPEESYHSQVTLQNSQPHLQSHSQPLYSSPQQQLAHQALEQPSPWQLLPQQQVQHLQPAYQEQYPQPYQHIPEMVLRPAMKPRRSGRVRRSVALNEEEALFFAVGRQKRRADASSEEEYDSEEKGNEEKKPRKQTKQPVNTKPIGSFESDEVRRPPSAPKPSKVSTTPKINTKPQKVKATPVTKVTTKPALPVTTKKPVATTPVKPIPPKTPSTPATTQAMDVPSVTEADLASSTSLLTEPVTSVDDLWTTFSEFVAATDNPETLLETTNAPVSAAQIRTSHESSEDSAEDPSGKESSVVDSSEFPESLEDSRESVTQPQPLSADYYSFEDSSEQSDSSEDYSKSIEDSSEYLVSLEKSSESQDSKEINSKNLESIENSSESPDSEENSSEYPDSMEKSVEVPDSLEKDSETSMSLEKSSEIEQSSEYPESSENYIDSTEGQKKEFKKSDSSEDSAEKGSVESTERASMESMEGSSSESTEKTSNEKNKEASPESIERSNMESPERASIESTKKASLESTERASLESTEKSSSESSEKTSIEIAEKAGLKSSEESSMETTEKTSIENTNNPSVSVFIEQASEENMASKAANATEGVEPKHAPHTHVLIQSNELDELKTYLSVENDIGNTESSVER